MCEIDSEEMDMKRYEELFKKLDRDGNGKIDIHDLRDALGMSEKFAQVSGGVCDLSLFLLIIFIACHRCSHFLQILFF